MNEVVVISKEELRCTIEAAVLKALSKVNAEANIKPESEAMTLEQAIEYLNTEKGYKIAKATIYKYIHEDIIPYHKRGSRVSFLRSELDAWLVDRTDTDKAQKRATEALSRSASNQLSERRG